MGQFVQNVRHALRQLGRNRGFTATVIITLALSIGANTAIFSIVNALMLKSLPYPQPERLGTIFTRVQGPVSGSEDQSIDGEQWELLRDNVPSLLSAVSSGMVAGVNLQADQHVQYTHAGRISAHYLDVLGIRPALGRNFSEDEDRPDGPPAVILSYSLWHNVFGADRKLLGQTIHLKGTPYTVVGVLGHEAKTPLNADLYTPLQPSRHGEGGGTNFHVIVRLRNGATWQQADAEINRAWANKAQEFARNGSRPGTRIGFETVPLQKGQTASLRPKALTLMSAAGFILLIACGNLAGLTLVRMARRTPELATRLALGASHWKIQKQLWMEALVLATLGGIAGIGMGYVALHGLMALLPEDFLRDFLRVSDVSLDMRVLGFTMAAALFTSVLFGMLPALAVRKLDLRSSMATRAVAGSERLRLRQALIACEVALTVVLLAASGLLVRTLIHLETLPPGFNPNGVMTAKASLDDTRYHDAAAFTNLLNKSVAAMQHIPGVQSAAVGLTLPFERALNDGTPIRNGKETGQYAVTGVVYITPDYLDVLQIPLLSGRKLTDSDNATSQPVVLVNQAFARKYFHGENPVGRVLGKDALIVGMVGDVRVKPGLNPGGPLETEEMMYTPASQMPSRMLALIHTWFQPSWIVRTAGPIEGLTEEMQHALADADPGLPFSGFYSMNDLQAETLVMERIEVALLSTMAALALILSAVGIFALVANMVAQRTREIGIRMALGSSVRQAMAHVAGSGVRASIAGLVLGLALSAAALRVMRSVLYGVSVYDRTTIASVVAVLLLIALGATILPSLRIARIDPATTLREE